MMFNSIKNSFTVDPQISNSSRGFTSKS